MTYTGAFVIPVGKYHNTKHLYFGVERNGEVSAFGGKRDRHESIHKCAIRELHEESHDVFAKGKTIKKMLNDQGKYHVNKIDMHNTSVTYFVPLKIKGNPMADFQKANSKKGLKHYQKEMTEVIAIKADDVITLVNSTQQGQMTIQGHKVRPLLEGVLRRAVQQNFL
ncbi:MAG: hypothetical protein JSR46_01790 [Verrucomicrobia bacterium]|nr:hypothetical protein [Verrucomicrobiota bacterium]